MNPTTTHPAVFSWPGPDFERNRAHFPASERAKWYGRHVAWSWDGKRVVAGAETLAALVAELQRLRVDPATVVFDFIDAPDAGG